MYTDERIWEVLEQVDLLGCALPDKLNEYVSEGGKTLASGSVSYFVWQELLRDRKFCCSTKQLQQLIETQMYFATNDTQVLADKTVLTIAHRLDTIMDSDRVLVLVQVRLLVRAPKNLVSQSNGLFRALVYAKETTTLKDCCR